MKNVLITHVNEYTGPGTLQILLRDKMQPFCHDVSFEDEDAALAFEKVYPGAKALKAQTPEEIHNELKNVTDKYRCCSIK